jgi:hypothetical protein
MLPRPKQIPLTQPASFHRPSGTLTKELPPTANKTQDLPNHPSPLALASEQLAKNRHERN